jgi:hypothetical protein
MRKFDKNKNIKKANLLAEQRHLESKGLIKEDNVVNENVFHAEGGVNVFTESEEVEEIEIPVKLQDEILNFFSQQRVGSAAIANDNKVAFYNWLEMMWSPENLHMGANSREIRTNNPATMAKYLDRRGISGKTFVKEENSLVGDSNLNESHYGSEEGKSYGSSIDRVNYSPEKGNTLAQFMDELIGKGLTNVTFVKVDGNNMVFSTDTSVENEIVGALGTSYDVKAIDSGEGNTLLYFNMV